MTLSLDKIQILRSRSHGSRGKYFPALRIGESAKAKGGFRCV